MMVLYDTSVLTAAASEDHVHHAASLRAVRAVHAGKIKGVISAHSLAECYSNLTAIPQPLVPSPESVYELLRRAILHHFTIIGLGQNDYWEALKRTVAKNFKSGAIFDALIYQAAVKKKVSHLVTWNVRDFERLSNGELKIVTPEDL